MLAPEPAPSRQWPERAEVMVRVELGAQKGSDSREEFEEFELLRNRKEQILCRQGRLWGNGSSGLSPHPFTGDPLT